MGLTIKKAGAHKAATQPYVKKGTSWKAATKAYIKKTGVWKEVWPIQPNQPASAAISTTFNGTDIVVNTSWTAPPAGGHPFDRYISQIVFIHPTSGAESPQGGIGHSTGTLSYTHTNGTTGYQHLAGWKVYVQVWAGRNATATLKEVWSVVRESAKVTVIQLPVPPAPTALDVNIASCALSMTWAHAGSPALTGFQVEIWLSGYASTTYNLAASARSHAQYPWNAATVGRHTVNARVRARGTGGDSAWVTISGVMPGPVALSSAKFQDGVYYVLVDNNYDGLHIWRDYYGATAWEFQQTQGATSGAAYWVSNTESSTYARDNSRKHRMVFQPYNATMGWTGRAQGSAYCIKIPYPMYFEAADCNTWWSIPIPGKWRTNPQADDWFYQGKSISGNSYGTLFYQTKLRDYFDDARLGYTPPVNSWYVYIQRTHTGGLVAAVALNMYLHNRQDDALAAAPGLTNGPQAGPSLARSQQAWVQIPNSWWANMLSGAARGISFYVDPNASDNQLRSEIGNVSNRYMILNKPHYGALISHGGLNRKVGTIVVYHNG